MIRRPAAAVALAVLATLAGCASGAKVGAGVNLKGHGAANLTFPGASSPSTHATKAPVISAPPSHAAVASVPPSSAPPPVASQPAPVASSAPAAPPFRISINGDTSNKPLFDPAQAAVYSGTSVVWTNDDTKAHSVVAEGGAFKSGLLGPGQSFTWVAGAPGTYSYQDGTRPYVNGQIQVYAR
ncbi:MAG: cupredoxin domain-containing protein [Mycobacteriales bacterium]